MFRDLKKIFADAQSNKGFSLLEVMIVCAMMGGMSLVMNQMMQTMTKTNIKFQSDNEQLLTMNEINSILSSPANCLATLGGKNALSDLTVDSVSRKGVKKFNINVKFGNANTMILEYSITSTTTNIAANSAKLSVKFDKKKILGPGTTTKNINLYVEVNGSNIITACRSIASEMTDNLWKHGASQANINYDTGNVGIGTDVPVEKLDVSGGIKIGTTNSSCTAANEGTLRANKASHNLEYCDSSSWVNVKFVGGP